MAFDLEDCAWRRPSSSRRASWPWTWPSAWRSAVGAAVALRLPAHGGEALLEGGHQVGGLGRLGLVGGRADDLLARGLVLEHLEQLLAVLVAVLVGLEVGGERLDQLLRHVELALLGLRRLLGEDVVAQVLGLRHLVVEAHRRHRQDVVHRADRGEVLLVAKDEAGDRDLAGVAHRLDEQGVGLLGALVGAEVVGLLEVDGVDLVEVDEVLDLDRAGLLRVEVRELLARQGHVLVGGELVALDDVVVGDLLAVCLGHALVAHPGAVLLAQLAEAHGVLRDRAVQLHRHVQQAEADRPAPNRSSHSLITSTRPFDAAEVTPVPARSLAGPCRRAWP